MGYLQSVGNSVEILGLCHTAVVGKCIGPTDYFVPSISRLDESLCNVAHIDNWHDILAGANQEAFARFHEADKACKTGGITRPINPCWAHDDDGGGMILDQTGNQLLARNLRAAIGIILSLIRSILSYDAM